GIGLQDDEPDAAELGELADQLRAEQTLQRLEHVADLDAEHFGLGAVEVDEELLARGLERGAHALELRPLSRSSDEILDRGVGGARIARAAVHDEELEVAGGTEAGNRGRIGGERPAVLARGELAIDALQRVEGKERRVLAQLEGL